MRTRRQATLVFIGALLGTACSLTASPELIDPGCAGNPPGPGALVAVDPASGEQLWETKVGQPSGVADFDSVVVVGTFQGSIRGFERATGRLRWCIERPWEAGEAGHGLVSAGERVAYTENAEVVAVDPGTGNEVWRQSVTTGDSSGTPPAAESNVSTIAPVSNSAGFILRGGESFSVSDFESPEVTLVELDPLDGSVRAEISPGVAAPRFSTLGQQNVPIDGVLLSTPELPYAAQEQRIALSPVDAATGDSLWNKTVPGVVATLVSGRDGPVVVVIDQTGGTGQVSGGLDTRVTAYRVTDSEQIWQVALPETPLFLSGIGSNAVVITGQDDLYAYAVDSGVELWTANHGSPGQDGPYTQAGNYQFLSTTGEPVVGMIVAKRTYRD